MEELFSLGKLYVSDFLKPGESPRNEKVEMKLMLDKETGCVRLSESAPMDCMYGKYWYRSGINQTMKDELKNIVESISKVYTLKENDLWLDIACNDGTLLSYVPQNMLRVGIDPSDDSFKVESEKHSNLIIQDFFSYEAYANSKFANIKPKVITTIAMFYDLENPDKFIQDICKIIDDNGVWVLQLSYTPLMIKQLAFDNVCFKSNTLIMGANKCISDIRIGDKVLDYKGQFTEVKNTFKRKYNGKMINIKGMYLENIQCTPEHPLYIVKSQDIKDKKIQWIDANKIEKGDYLVIPKIKTEKPDYNIDLTKYNNLNSPFYRRGLKSVILDEDFIWMMGLYVAEGHISGKENNLQINFTLNQKETEYANRIIKIFNKIGYKATIRNSTISKAMNVQVSCTSLAKAFIEWFGKGALNKKIPDFLFKSDRNTSIHFLTGLINGDGTISKQVSLHSSSKTLINQVQLMLATLNAMTGISYVKPYDRIIRNGKVKSKDSWQLRGTNPFISSIFNNNYDNNNEIAYKFDNEYIYVLVSSITTEKFNGYVHNIETENNTYVVSNAVVHNCHEHIYYYSLFNFKKMLEKNGMKIMDCSLNDVNGGSFRVFVMKETADTTKFSTQPNRDVCELRIDSLLKYEESLKLDEPEIWMDFFHRINYRKETTVNFLKKEKSKGKTIWAYGASTKGNTLLQYFGLDNTIIDGIAERNIDKWGLRTVGTDIPIYSEDEMRKANPDYLLVLPWHFINEFKQREKDYLLNGGQLVVPCPNFEIIKH